VTDSNDEARRPDGEDDEGEQDKDLDAFQSVSTSLRSAQSQTRAGDAGIADDASEDDDVDASDTSGSDDD
jgi:hypothetical protein